MILKDHAIALRIHPFGNTSRIVVWMSCGRRLMQICTPRSRQIYVQPRSKTCVSGRKHIDTSWSVTCGRRMWCVRKASR